MDTSHSNPSAPALRRLGRYELVHLLGQGGMGEVYLAKISGAAGFEKACIVKTILPALLKDRQFLDRFHHEAKVLVHLAHSSIAQVYDMGEAEDTYYMALEYVAGVDLAYLQEQARAQGRAIPVPVALYLGQRMAEGLGYAHRKAGPDGTPLGIVHRDVSPHNVMVSYDGEVKVIDFGLAKSAARSKYTLPSTVMGKLGYMSPEQVRAEPVDHRTDLYSCGVVVWELLAGRSLIAHGTVGEMMAAMSHPIVPSLNGLREDVTPALDAAIQRALAADFNERYARADDFARALNEHFLHTGSSVGAEEVGNFVRELCPQAFTAQRELVGRLASGSTSRRSSATPRIVVPQHTGIQYTPAEPSPAHALESGPQAFADTLMRSPAATPLPTASTSAPVETPTPRGPGRKGWAVAVSLGALGLVGATAGLTAVLMTRGAMSAPERTPIILERPPPPPPLALGDGFGRTPPPPLPPPPVPSEPTPPPALSAPLDTAVRSNPARFITPGANGVAPIQALGSAFVIKRGRREGLAPGMVLAVVEAPVRDGKAKVLGSATVLGVLPQHATLSLDAHARNMVRSARFVVMPSGAEAHETVAPVQKETVVPEAHETPSPVAAAPTVAAPTVATEPRKLSGRIRINGLGPFATIVLTSTDTVVWSECSLVTHNRAVFKLGGMAPGGEREVPVIRFERGGREVPFVNLDRLGLFCAEGQREFPARL